MRKEFTEKIAIPQGIQCLVDHEKLSCTKGGVTLSYTLHDPKVKVFIEENTIRLYCKSGSRKDYGVIKSFVAHINKILAGLDKKYEYTLEACNVHFPMTLKLDKNTLLINNFLGERVPRQAKILPQVDIKITGQKIVLSSHDKDAAGQTAANIERATKIRFRDRRVFQDGIFITHKQEEPI